MNKFSILNGAKYFSSGIFQNYLVFIPPTKYIRNITDTTRMKCGNLMEFQKKVLKIKLDQTAILHQLL